MRSHTLFAFGALLTTASAVPDQLLPTRDTCYSGVFTIVARGSEEPQGQSVLEAIVGNVTAAIPNSGSNEVVYPALLSFWDSAPTGVTDAQQQMQDYHAKCPDGKIVLMGYSQGSYVLSTALAGGNFSGQTWAPIASDIGDSSRSICQSNITSFHLLTAVILSRGRRRIRQPGSFARPRHYCRGHKLRKCLHRYRSKSRKAWIGKRYLTRHQSPLP